MVIVYIGPQCLCNRWMFNIKSLLILSLPLRITVDRGLGGGGGAQTAQQSNSKVLDGSQYFMGVYRRIQDPKVVLRRRCAKNENQSTK